MSRERNAVVGSGEAGGLALRGGSDARNENGLRVTRHVCGVLSIGLGCELARFRRYTSGFRGVTRTRKISLGLELLLSILLIGDGRLILLYIFSSLLCSITHKTLILIS